MAPANWLSGQDEVDGSESAPQGGRRTLNLSFQLKLKYLAPWCGHKEQAIQWQ
jgi:hypothetical protein